MNKVVRNLKRGRIEEKIFYFRLDRATMSLQLKWSRNKNRAEKNSYSMPLWEEIKAIQFVKIFFSSHIVVSSARTCRKELRNLSFRSREYKNSIFSLFSSRLLEIPTRHYQIQFCTAYGMFGIKLTDLHTKRHRKMPWGCAIFIQ